MIRCPSCGAFPSAAEECGAWMCDYLGALEQQRVNDWEAGLRCRWCGGATSDECVCEDRA